MNSETKKNLSLFLKNLADDIENDKLNEKELKYTGEFYMSYLVQNQIDNDEDIDVSDKDLVKFLFLGWYMYNIAFKKNNILQ
jgi:hypothetical protein